MSAADYPRVHVKAAAEWRRWLREHHAKERGAWLVSYRRITGKPAVEYDDAVREALCYGWIDGQLKPLDERRSMLLFAPRRPGSAWSRSNRERVRALTAAGRMRPSGLAKVAAAKRDGSFTLLVSVEELRMPADLKTALASSGVTGTFRRLSDSAKRAHLFALVSAKRPETRARRLAAIVRALRT